jgi:tRNA U34 2-thiouridine synthase MnmA/TrmU
VPQPATVTDVDANTVLLRCVPPVTQVAPGQAGVLLDGDEVVGGGVVSAA